MYSLAAWIEKKCENIFSFKGYVSEGGTLTASPGQTYKVIACENSTSAYSVVKEGVVPCSGTLDIEAGCATYDPTVTETVWLEDGSVMSGTNVMDMGASGEYTLPFKLAVTAKRSFGNPDHPGKGNIMCISYNSSSSGFTSIEVSGATSAPTPNEITTGAGNSTSCYFIPVIQNDPDVSDGTVISDLVVDGKYEGDLLFETASGFTGGVGNINHSFKLVDTAYDLDADTLADIFDVEDEDNNDLACQALEETKIYVK